MNPQKCFGLLKWNPWNLTVWIQSYIQPCRCLMCCHKVILLSSCHFTFAYVSRWIRRTIVNNTASKRKRCYESQLMIYINGSHRMDSANTLFLSRVRLPKSSSNVRFRWNPISLLVEQCWIANHERCRSQEHFGLYTESSNAAWKTIENAQCISRCGISKNQPDRVEKIRRQNETGEAQLRVQQNYAPAWVDCNDGLQNIGLCERKQACTLW